VAQAPLGAAGRGRVPAGPTVAHVMVRRVGGSLSGAATSKPFRTVITRPGEIT
jgi:hypothetical protein